MKTKITDIYHKLKNPKCQISRCMQKDILSYQKENASYSKFYFCSMLEDLTNKKEKEKI